MFLCPLVNIEFAVLLKSVEGIQEPSDNSYERGQLFTWQIKYKSWPSMCFLRLPLHKQSRSRLICTKIISIDKHRWHWLFFYQRYWCISILTIWKRLQTGSSHGRSHQPIISYLVFWLFDCHVSYNRSRALACQLIQGAARWRVMHLYPLCKIELTWP